MTQLTLFTETYATSLLSENLTSTSESADAPYFHRIYAVVSHGLHYYRYVCNQGHRVIIQETIPGGNVNRRIAQARAAQVKAWISQDLPPEEIQRRIKQWARRKPGSKSKSQDICNPSP